MASRRVDVPLRLRRLPAGRRAAYTQAVSKKSAKIAALIADHAVDGLAPHYVGYFDCFNRGLYYEAHDVLEELWLTQGKAGANYAFYKGLIQLAGAFVHLQKNRLRPAVALFNLAEANLRNYSDLHERLDVATVLALIEQWRGEVARSGFEINPLVPGRVPRLALH
jgi:predicted metal-dependent hydrolase